jgi:hypothetical protein
VGANTSALTELDVSWCGLGDAGLRLLFDVLPANTHLTKLDCEANTLTDAIVFDGGRFRRRTAVRANGSLRQLSCTPQMDNLSGAATQALAEAEAHVAQRAAAR